MIRNRGTDTWLKNHIVSSFVNVRNSTLHPSRLRINPWYLTSAFYLRFIKCQLANQTNEIIAGHTCIHVYMLGENKKGKADVVTKKYQTHTETDLPSDNSTFMCNFSA